jgi:hypothetical protein
MPDPSHGVPREPSQAGAIEHDADRVVSTEVHHAHHILDRWHNLAVAIEHVVEHEEPAEVIEFRERFDDWDRALDHYLEDRDQRKRA